MAYTNIDDPSAYFHTQLYAGNGGTQSITNNGNSDLQPDWIWIKSRSDSSFNALTDSTRGTSKRLYSNSTSAEETHSDRVTAFNSDGFSLGASSLVNTNTYNYAAWQWKANGGTTATNSDGSTDTTVQANTTAGFSIVTFTTDGGNETYGHGLGVKPDIVIVKSRSGGGSWIYMTDVIDGSVDYLLLNGTNAAADLSYGAFTSSTFQYNDNNAITQLAYCFASKQGYSKCGKFVGNGSTDGPFVYTGFKPAFVMIKNASATESWVIYDTKRSSNNPADLKLSPDTADSENDNSAIGGAAYNNIDILSNGFKCVKNNAATNGSGNTLIFMAFAENPFVTSTGIPTTAR
jgi:hypothetical protein